MDERKGYKMRNEYVMERITEILADFDPKKNAPVEYIYDNLSLMNNLYLTKIALEDSINKRKELDV